MTTATSRRAILAGAAALPALAMPAIAASSDPIFAAIEAHKLAFLRRMQTSSVVSNYPDFGPRHDKDVHARIHKADSEAMDADVKGAFALTTTPPATLAGVFALIEYVEDFNHSKFGIDNDWRSAPHCWPAAGAFSFDGVENEDDEVECVMAYALLLNVRNALQAMAVRS